MSNVVRVAARDVTLLQLGIGRSGKRDLEERSIEKRQVDENAVAEALAALVREVVEAFEPLLDFVGGISSKSRLH